MPSLNFFNLHCSYKIQLSTFYQKQNQIQQSNFSTIMKLPGNVKKAQTLFSIHYRTIILVTRATRARKTENSNLCK